MIVDPASDDSEMTVWSKTMAKDDGGEEMIVANEEEIYLHLKKSVWHWESWHWNHCFLVCESNTHSRSCTVTAMTDAWEKSLDKRRTTW